MLFKKRKLYKVGAKNAKFLLALIPTVVCEDMDLNKDSLIEIEYDVVKKVVIIRKES